MSWAKCLPAITIGVLLTTNALAGGISADGVIEAKAGGFKFPDGSIQQTAAPTEPSTQITSVPFVITESGSYFLSGNLTMTGSGDAITIEADGVSLDLRGFVLEGGGLGTNGIVIVGGVTETEVENGTIRGFTKRGIDVDSFETRGQRLLDLRVVDNGAEGIFLGSPDSQIENCLLLRNQLEGIIASAGSILKNNIASSNNGAGISAGRKSIVEGNVALENRFFGITVGDGSIVRKNVVARNQLTGILAGSHCQIISNTANSNNLDGAPNSGGIFAFQNCEVRNNVAKGNVDNNIWVESTGNSVIDNLVADSDNGIVFATSENFFRDNRSTSNNRDFFFLAGAPVDGGGNFSY